jgi:hypothetical protein
MGYRKIDKSLCNLAIAHLSSAYSEVSIGFKSRLPHLNQDMFSGL